MHVIDRYVIRQIAGATVFMALALTFAVWLTQSLRLFDFIVNRGLPADRFLVFAGLLMPYFMGIVLPIGLFVSVLFIYNKLLADRELIVMRAAGLSPWRLARPAIFMGLIVVLIGYSISMYLQPTSLRSFKDLQWELRNDYSTVLLQEGVFSEVEDGVTLYVRQRNDKGELLGLMVHDTRDPDAPVTMLAKSGALVNGENGPTVVMLEGNRQQIDRKTGQLSLLRFDRYTVELSQFTGEGETWRWRKPNERYMSELFGEAQSEEDRRYRPELIVEGHQRIVGPLYTLAFIFIALACLLSGEFNRRGQLKRILLAVVLVGGMEAAKLSVQGLVINTPDLIFVMYLVALSPILICSYVLQFDPLRKKPGRQQERLAAR
ncbi:LPS export ABC transporter permease LptF [Rhodovibrionaceae bacterium A322]